MVADQGAARSIRVCVRVRPQLPSDGITGTELLQLDHSNGVVLSSGSERRGGRRYAFDSVFGPQVTQDDLYMRAGVPEMVAAAAAGFHATVFAYGQTGSGKTYTMEGYRYVGAGGGGAAAAGTGTAAAAGSPAGKAGAARSVPHADFISTPESQLGIIPRAVRDLFAAVHKNQDRRFAIKCSFVQIYREQVYDLLNPASLSPGQHQKQQQQRGGVAAAGAAAAAGGPLKLRWSKAEEFYLENLFTPEVESAEEAMAVFQAGVANKVMSSHRLNAASSRSHCLFTLHVASCPAASPLELTASRLTLVDLAGSERAAHTGATEGALRDESVAINKSLFTLRQVITALTDAAAAAAAQAAADAAADGAQAPPPPMPHVPYRDSKLTCLLKHSLGGNSWTLMLACLSPANRFYEENASTLDYAARARKITNQVAVNEDPRSRLIRELRAEVAFLRQQLEAAGAAAATTGAGLGIGAGGATAAAGPAAAQRLTAAAGAGGAPGARGAAASGAPGAESGSAAGAAGVGGLAAAGEDEEAVAKRLRTSDVEALVRSVIEASRVAVSSSTALAGLRTAYARASSALEALRAEHEALQAEDVRLRDRLALLESLVGASGPAGINIMGAGGAAGLGGGGGDGGAGGGGAAAGAYTASTAAFIELEELRRENALLHERLQLLDPGVTQPLPPHTLGGGGSSGGGGLLGRAGGQAGSRGTGASRRSGTGASGGMPPRGSPAPSSPHAAATRGLNRAQSAGVLRASGRLPTAAASATANPFTPREVLLAVGAAGAGTGPGSFAKTGRPPLTAGGSSGRTLTVEQLRSVLQMGGGAGGGCGSPRPPTDPGSASPPPPQPQQHYAFTDSRPSTSASALGGAAAGPGGRLAELGHSVASRALGSGVRLSTTGKLLPAAPARIAVEAGGGGGGGLAGGTLQRPITSSSSFSKPGVYGFGDGGGRGPGEEADDSGADGGGGGGGGGEREPPMQVGSYSSGQPAEAEVLTQLLAERNAMTRQRLGAG
ncbi:hypothetical protein HYH02_005121 [Chlamydomonas schloesseri]|uniref:Kinesin motor domain-containing protein n=1 Tax=Chlamydomonas schloesseri TaxID=2026947 RepID=A0A836B7B8_9CHLO|nr:hypothetical protein HYH02_005121 [Chlamydomonas schloesseri]|eukprot:KAG2449588.1 hypothetical protein HYH02_005121 [Chlamydomonas schloesseri]